MAWGQLRSDSLLRRSNNRDRVRFRRCEWPGWFHQVQQASRLAHSQVLMRCRAGYTALNLAVEASQRHTRLLTPQCRYHYGVARGSVPTDPVI